MIIGDSEISDKIKQSFPWYKTSYLDKKDWEKKETSHYIFYYFKDSLAENDIEKILQEKEKQYKKIISFLGVKNRKKIKYYLYPSIKIKKKLMGDDSLGNAIWKKLKIKGDSVETKKFEIHVVYSKRYKFIGEHEDTHLLSLPWGLSIYLFQEGLAQFMEGNLFGRDIDDLSRELVKNKENYSIVWLFNNRNWRNLNPKILYPIVGSFVRFLIKKYGKEKFKRVYRETSREKNLRDDTKIVRKIYLKPVEKLEKEWIKYLFS